MLSQRNKVERNGEDPGNQPLVFTFRRKYTYTDNTHINTNIVSMRKQMDLRKITILKTPEKYNLASFMYLKKDLLRFAARQRFFTALPS